jgi:CubicO group peptidase (beta-lactamase class C family)
MKNPRDIVKNLLNDQNPEDEICAYDAQNWRVSSASVATSESPIRAENCNSETVFNIASISKTFAAATILKMTEDERFAHLFSSEVENKIDTPIQNFIPYLKSRYPDSDYIQTGLEAEKNFDEITIAHLLNHSSGIGEFDRDDFRKLAFESPESLAREPDGKFFTVARKIYNEGENKPEFGKYFYSDLGYELLGMIIAATSSQALGRKATCGETIKELIIRPLGLEHSFTQDEMTYDEDGKVKVVDRPDIEVAQGYDSNDGKAHPSLVFRRCIATSGIYSTPSDICKFADAFFSNKKRVEGGLFDNPKTIEMRDSRPVITKKDEFYAAGYEAYQDRDGSLVKLHGAFTQGFFGWMGYKNGQSACCLVSCVNNSIAPTPEITNSAVTELRTKTLGKGK